MWKKESYSEPLQSETCAAAKENCGRKSLLIEHEVCHLKLESSQTPETAAGRHLSGPYIKVPPGSGCVSPSHRGPFALAGGPFRLRARPHRGTSRRVRCAINAPALRSAPASGLTLPQLPQEEPWSWGEEPERLAASCRWRRRRRAHNARAQKHSVAGFSRAKLGFFVWQIDVHRSPKIS